MDVGRLMVRLKYFSDQHAGGNSCCSLQGQEFIGVMLVLIV